MRRTLIFLLVTFAAGFVILACGKKSGGTRALQIAGTVSQQGTTAGAPTTLSGATVQLLVNGVAKASTTTDTSGKYALKTSVPLHTNVVIAFTSDGDAPSYKTLSASNGANLSMNATLRQLESLDCSSGPRCSVGSAKLSISGLPAGYSGGARVFNPVTEPDAFPGDFSDANGNLLISGVFSSVSLTDGSGNPVDTLPNPADLRMEVPRDTWPVVKDMTPGNGQIDVPLYSFDKTQGTWIAEGNGILEDGDGNVIPESSLASIKNGSFSGTVVAKGSVTHFSEWNIDWPVSTHACLTGRLLDASGSPANGAVITASGVTYYGWVQPYTVGSDGRFCVDVMKSEAAGEDINQNGVTGETMQVSLRIAYNGKLYDGGTHDDPVNQGSCDGTGGTCTDVGDIKLDSTHELTAAICNVTGTVVHNGTPEPNADVYAWDNTLDSTIADALCSGGTCVPYGTSDSAGSFTLSVPVVGSLTLEGYAIEQPDANTQIERYGERDFTGCPTGPVTLSLDDGYEYLTLTVAESSNTITWMPARPAEMLFAEDAASNPLWEIYEDTSLFSSPVTYGTVPTGAQQLYPTTGAPTALGTGDVVQVITSGTTTDGLPSYGSGTYTLP